MFTKIFISISAKPQKSSLSLACLLVRIAMWINFPWQWGLPLVVRAGRITAQRGWKGSVLFAGCLPHARAEPLRDSSLKAGEPMINY